MPRITQDGLDIIFRSLGVVRKPGEENGLGFRQHGDQEPLSVCIEIEPGVIQSGVDAEADGCCASDEDIFNVCPVYGSGAVFYNADLLWVCWLLLDGDVILFAILDADRKPEDRVSANRLIVLSIVLQDQAAALTIEDRATHGVIGDARDIDIRYISCANGSLPIGNRADLGGITGLRFDSHLVSAVFLQRR